MKSQGVTAGQSLKKDLLEGNISASKECYPISRRSRTMIAYEREFLKAHKQIEQLIERVRQAGEDGRRIDEVERTIFTELLQVGFHLLSAFIGNAGDGDLGKTVDVPATATRPTVPAEEGQMQEVRTLDRKSV